MDNASDYGSEDSRFESWQAREQFLRGSKTVLDDCLGKGPLPEPIRTANGDKPLWPSPARECNGGITSMMIASYTLAKQINKKHCRKATLFYPHNEWILMGIFLIIFSPHWQICDKVSRGQKILLAERGFDPRTSGLWAQHASTAPLCYTMLYLWLSQCQAEPFGWCNSTTLVWKSKILACALPPDKCIAGYALIFLCLPPQN